LYLENAVFSCLFLFENVQRLGAVSRRDDPVRDFSGDDAGGGEIAGRRERDKVSEGRHAVGT
jgi:hypothetical protein